MSGIGSLGIGVRAITRDVPRNLSVAWLAVSPLYFFDFRTLPEPLVAFVISTAVGLVVTLFQVALSGEDHAAPAPPARSAERAVQVRPALVRALPTSHTIPTSHQEPTGHPVPTAPVSQLDFGRYSVAGPDEMQCPRCGGFDVRVHSTAGPGSSRSCTTCEFPWHVDPLAPPPDVVVRSWLHP